jgi:hypothetical protein
MQLEDLESIQLIYSIRFISLTLSLVPEESQISI